MTLFDRILYINLSKRTNRKEHLLSQLKKINYNGSVERINAIDGSLLKLNLIPNSYFTNKALEDSVNTNLSVGSYMTKGALGCALSHKIAYENILFGEGQYVLILEDDIFFVDDFNERLQILSNNIKKEDFDILYLGYSSNGIYINNEFYDNPSYVYGTFAYIVNKKAAKYLLEIFPLNYQLDSEIPRCFNQLNVLTVKSNNKLILSDLSHIDDNFPSDIQKREFELTENFDSIVINNFKNIYLIIIIIILFYIFYFITI